jgi:hypothetical protein
MDRQTKTQNEGVARTHIQDLHIMKLTQKRKQYHLQSYRVFLINLNQKQIPHPPFHMENECGAKF